MGRTTQSMNGVWTECRLPRLRDRANIEYQNYTFNSNFLMVNKKFIVIQLVLSMVLGIVWLIRMNNDEFHTLFIFSFLLLGLFSQLHASYLNRKTLISYNNRQLFIYRLFRQMFATVLLACMLIIFSLLHYFLVSD